MLCSVGTNHPLGIKNKLLKPNISACQDLVRAGTKDQHLIGERIKNSLWIKVHGNGDTGVFNLAERLTVILSNKVHKYRKQASSQGIKTSNDSLHVWQWQKPFQHRRLYTFAWD